MKKLFTFIVIAIISANTFGQTFNEILKTVAIDRAAGDRLGYAVAVSGNYAIIGAYGDDFGPVDPNMGSAYIFEKTGIEDWTFVQKINNSDQDDYDRFGYSVAIDGNFAVIGAYAEDEDADDANTLDKAGSAYVFQRGEDGVWTEMQKLVASDRDVDDEFGWALDIYDSTIIIGAHHEGHDVSGVAYEYHAGSAYIFDLNDAGIWVESQKIVASHRSDDHYYPEGRPDPADEDFSDLFGGSVAIWGDYIVVGSHMHDYGAGGVGTGLSWNAGAAYVFERTSGVWSEVKKLLPTIRNPYDRYGHAVDIDSSIIVVGVWSEDESEFEAASLMNAGGAYIVERNGMGDWIQIQKLDASDRATGDHFGRSVAIHDNLLVIGAEQQNEGGDIGLAGTLDNSGAAYLFEKDEDGIWSEFQKITPMDRRDTDLFGEDVAISGTTVIVGAWQQDLNEMGTDSIEDAGAAYIYSSLICVEEYTTQDITICEGDSLIVGESVYYSNGTYIDTLLNIDVCDSIVTTNLMVTEPIFFDQSITICSGNSIIVGANEYSVSGTYLDSLISEVTLCDSIVTTILEVSPAIVHTQTIDLCYGETYSIGASIYDESGTYEDSLITDLGCDSIVTTILSIEEENLVEQTITICSGESVIVGDNEYTEAGIYTDVLTSMTLCDSTVITTIEIDTYIDITLSFPEVTTLVSNEPFGGSISYQWVKCDPFTIIPGAITQSFTATENGEYAVIINKDFCTDTSDCVPISHVGIESNGPIGSLYVYPNPANDFLIVDNINYQDEQSILRIYDVLGAIIMEEKITAKQVKLNIEILPTGVYTIVLENRNGISTSRFAKK